MSHEEAVNLIQPFVRPDSGTWADIGAGTGVFALALQEILSSGKILALDKSTHMLWRLPLKGRIPIEVVEGDFTRSLDLEPLDGILMANALHYAPDPAVALRNSLVALRPGGTLLLLEYNTDRPSLPYVPYPISEQRIFPILEEAGLENLRIVHRIPSIYQGEMYLLTGNASAGK